MKALILSINSDIGEAIADHLFKKGYEVFGTYKNKKPKINISDENLFRFEIKDFDSSRYKFWLKSIGEWDLFISCVGTQKPVGKFIEQNINDWVEAVAVNSSYQIAALINAIRERKSTNHADVILFAGGGTNSANPYYSSYTLGKISLIKAVELLANEIEFMKFTILGPGWVKTKIHEETISAKEKAGENYIKTLEMISNPHKFNPIEKVVEDILQIISLPTELVSGRNFSSVHDDLSIDNLKRLNELDVDFYKLRRKLNNQ